MTYLTERSTDLREEVASSDLIKVVSEELTKEVLLDRVGQSEITSLDNSQYEIQIAVEPIGLVREIVTPESNEIEMMVVYIGSVSGKGIFAWIFQGLLRKGRGGESGKHDGKWLQMARLNENVKEFRDNSEIVASGVDRFARALHNSDGRGEGLRVEWDAMRNLPKLILIERRKNVTKLGVWGGLKTSYEQEPELILGLGDESDLGRVVRIEDFLRIIGSEQETNTGDL